MTAVEMICEEMDSVATKAEAKSTFSIVVATDGSEASDAAFAAAELIEKKIGCRVYVLSVLEPLPMLLPGPDAMLIPPEVEEERTEVMRQAIGRQARRFNPKVSWDIELRLGRPGEVIARFVREHGARMLIVGANKHGLWGRMLGEETAMEIARLTEVPLLVASHEMQCLPKRVVVAMDIKPYGLEEMPAALCAIADTRTVSCVHVKPRAEFMGIDWAEFDREYEIAMQDRFGVLERALGKAGFRPDLTVRHGDVTRELAEFAEYCKADLVVVGINRHRGRLRAAGGRLASRMLRQLKSSVLIVPGKAHSGIQTGFQHRGVTDVLEDKEQWSSAMKGFTARNAARICTLEIDDPEIGALVEAQSYPLLGVDYDHKDGRLTIIVGETKGVEKHLSRSVPQPESIAILSVGGKDAAMSVVHGAGQTLLTFE